MKYYFTMYTNKKKLQEIRVKAIKLRLERKFRAEFKAAPFTFFITEWNDGDFEVILRATVFHLGKQWEQIRLPHTQAILCNLRWRRNAITETKRIIDLYEGKQAKP